VERRIDELEKKVRYCERYEELRGDIEQLKKAVGYVNGKNLSTQSTEIGKDIDKLKGEIEEVKQYKKMLIGGLGLLVLNLILQVIQINGGS